MNRFYVYLFMREDFFSPYYVGKGTGKRWRMTNGRVVPSPPDKSRIIKIKDNLTEEESKELEKKLILFWGRKDLGTGVLHNRTDGGDGTSGWIPSQEWRDEISKRNKGKMKGKNNPNFGNRWTDEMKRNLSEKRKGWKMNEEQRRLTGQNNPNTKTWKLTTPDGEIIIQKGLYNFCKERGLDSGNLVRVSQGKQSHHKGWKCEEM